jgi:hypothetical protein
MKKCKECGSDFEPQTKKAVFCSLACRQKDYRKRRNSEFETFRAVVAGINNRRAANPIETQMESPSTPKKSHIVRGIQWYVSQIRDLQFEDEFRTMHEMILTDEYLTKKEKESLILSFTNR